MLIKKNNQKTLDGRGKSEESLTEPCTVKVPA